MGTKVVNDVIANPTEGKSILIGYPKLQIAPNNNSNIVFDEQEGWRDLGLIEPGSVDMDFASEIHDVTSGSPASVKKRFVVGRSGKLTCALAEATPFAKQVANGSTITPEVSYPAVPVVEATSAISTAKDNFIVANADAASFTVGDMVELPQGSATYGTWKVYRRVKEIGAADSGGVGNAKITLEGETDMLTASGVNVNVVASIKYPVGGNYLQDWQVRLLFSATNGDILIVHLPTANVTEALKMDLKDGKSHVTMPVAFEAIGTAQTVSGFTDKQLVLANLYEIFA